MIFLTVSISDWHSSVTKTIKGIHALECDLVILKSIKQHSYKNLPTEGMP